MDRSDRSIQQTAGDGATQIGEVHGNVYIGSPASEAEVPLDLDAYREHQLSQLAIWEQQYTRLDVDPAVALAGQDLRPVPDSRLALTEALLGHERLVVVGSAGAGKTTSMRYLMASTLPGGSLNERLADFVPVYIDLGRIRGDLPAPLDNLLLLIAETLALGMPLRIQPALRGVYRLLKTHRFLFLLDALNEARAELRTPCLTAIMDLEKLSPEHRFALSTRPHGCSPPQGWEVVLLRELEDKQISEFVERYSQNEVRDTILEVVAHNPLLRIPLFLDLALKMGGSPHPVDQRLLRSRSGLVKAYVESLLLRGFTSSERILSLDQLRTALDRLAQATQATGQVLSLSEARHAVETDTPGQPVEAQRILADLCERGFLITDGQNLRFWHQTIQEYFYAGGIVRRWRGSKKQVSRMPRWLRRLVAKPEEEEALSFMVAHLRDEEMEDALHYGLPINPALTISWVDDLSLENRAAQITERFPARVIKLSLITIRYTRSGMVLASTIGVFVWLAPLLGVVLAGLLSWLGEASLTSLLGFTKVETVIGALILCGNFYWSLPFLNALLLHPSAKKLEAVLGAIPEIRDIPLRKVLGAVAGEISHSRMARPEIRALAQGVSLMETVNDEELIRLIRTSDAPYATTCLIGQLDTPVAIPLLAELLKINNSRSLAALEALAMRGNRLRNERQEVITLLWAVWRNDKIDNLIRRRAWKLLSLAGEHPGGRGILLRYFMLRFLHALAIALCLAVTGISLPAEMLLVLILGLSALVWWDARRIGARSIQGHPRLDQGPSGWATDTLFLFFLAVPYYLLNRQRIRREAAPVDWDAILQAIQAKGPHGDSLSITHPSPSPPSPRR